MQACFTIQEQGQFTSWIVYNLREAVLKGGILSYILANYMLSFLTLITGLSD